MRERAARIVAELVLLSSASSGTEIKVTVPGGIVFGKNQPIRRSLFSRVKSTFSLKRQGLRFGMIGIRPGLTPSAAPPIETSRLNSVVYEWEHLTPVLNRWIPPPRVLHPIPMHASTPLSFVRAICLDALVRTCAGGDR